MRVLDTRDPAAVALVDAIHLGDVSTLTGLLAADPGLADCRLGDLDQDGTARSLLHVATDWPGHFPDVGATITALVDAGADVNTRFIGPHRETPLHWAASSNDLEALVALLDHGADIDADGAVIAGGTPLGDATAFGQWAAARVLVERGAAATLFDLAGLGTTERVLAIVDGRPPASRDEINHAFWSACHGGRLETAQVLVERGADVNWLPGWEQATPLDIAARAEAHDVIRWLHGQGACTCADLSDGDC